MKTIIIDGSNVVRKLFRFTGKDDFATENKWSQRLIRAVSYFNRHNAYRIELYFDGPKRALPHSNNVELHFSKYKKADDLIVNSVYETMQYSQTQPTVITQDRELIEKCKSYGALIQSVYAFLSNLDHTIMEYA